MVAETNSSGPLPCYDPSSSSLYPKRLTVSRFTLLRIRSSTISSASRRTNMYVGFHINFLLFFCLILTKPEFSQQILVKVPNITFHEKPLGVELFHVGGRTDIQDGSFYASL